MTAVSVVPHDPEWNSLFDRAAEEIRRAFPTTPLLLFHMGSTSVPGIAAKPVIDILGEVEDLDDIDACAGSLIAIGFEALGEFGMVQRRFFRRPPLSVFPCAIHLHVYAAGDPQIERHLRFRDYLRAHPAEAKKYEELKQNLAKTFANDREGYNEGKEKYAQELNRKALLWTSPPLHRHLNAAPRPKKWTQDKLLKALEGNLYFHMTHLLRYTPGAEYIGRNTVSWVSTPVADDEFNYAIQTHLQPRDLDLWIDRTIAYFQSKTLPFFWWVGPSDEPKNLGEKLKERGFRLAQVYKGMAAEVKDFPLLANSPRIERIADPERLADFCSIWEQSGFSKELYPHVWKQIPSCLYGNNAPIEIYVGYIGKTPVVSGFLSFYARIAGIYWVATIPSERRKGHASAMMRHLLWRASQEKYQIAALLTPHNASNSFYQKFGFAELADFYEYSYKG